MSKDIDIETLQKEAEWAEYKLAHPQLKSKIGEGLPKIEKGVILCGVRFFRMKDRHFYEILYMEMQDD